MAVCKHTHTYLLTRIPFAEGPRNACSLRPTSLKVSFWMGAAGPWHLADARSHLQSQTGMKRTTSCWFKVLPGGPPAFEKFRDLPISIHSIADVHWATSFHVYCLPLCSFHPAWEAGTVNSPLTDGETEARGAGSHPKSQKQSGAELGVQTETSRQCSKVHKH